MQAVSGWIGRSKGSVVNLGSYYTECSIHLSLFVFDACNSRLQDIRGSNRKLA